MWIRDGENLDPGSGSRDKHSGSATLEAVLRIRIRKMIVNHEDPDLHIEVLILIQDSDPIDQ
jgi:hypothetical protein